MTKRKILTFISAAATLSGMVLLVTGDITNGLLAMILGELIDIPKHK